MMLSFYFLNRCNLTHFGILFVLRCWTFYRFLNRPIMFEHKSCIWSRAKVFLKTRWRKEILSSQFRALQNKTQLFLFFSDVFFLYNQQVLRYARKSALPKVNPSWVPRFGDPAQDTRSKIPYATKMATTDILSYNIKMSNIGHYRHRLV